MIKFAMSSIWKLKMGEDGTVNMQLGCQSHSLLWKATSTSARSLGSWQFNPGLFVSVNPTLRPLLTAEKYRILELSLAQTTRNHQGDEQYPAWTVARIPPKKPELLHGMLPCQCDSECMLPLMEQSTPSIVSRADVTANPSI